MANNQAVGWPTCFLKDMSMTEPFDTKNMSEQEMQQRALNTLSVALSAIRTACHTGEAGLDQRHVKLLWGIADALHNIPDLVGESLYSDSKCSTDKYFVECLTRASSLIIELRNEGHHQKDTHHSHGVLGRIFGEHGDHGPKS